MRTKISHALFPAITSFVLVATSTIGQEAYAQSAEQAETLNTSGKEHFKAHRYLNAYRDFKKAADMSPQGKYFFNVCFSLNYLERYQEAIHACEQVEPNGADEKLLEKTNAVLAALREKVPAQVSPPTPVEPPDQNNSTPPDPDSQTPVTPPPPGGVASPNLSPSQTAAPDPFAQKEEEYPYEWSLGASLALQGNSFGNANQQYDNTGARLNIFANFNLFKGPGIGVQGLFSFAGADYSAPNPNSDNLTIVDFGVGLYKHFDIGHSLKVTPGVGLFISGLVPSSDSDASFSSGGLRTYASIDWAMGSGKEHVLSIIPALSFYGAANSINDQSPRDYGLNKGATTFELGIGYQYRFTTPFTSGQPIFTLE